MKEQRTDRESKKELKTHGWSWWYFCWWHITKGWFVSVPYLFAAGYFYEKDGKTICYVTYARGDLKQLFRLGLQNYVDIIEYDRRFSEKDKCIDARRFERKVNYG